MLCVCALTVNNMRALRLAFRTYHSALQTRTCHISEAMQMPAALTLCTHHYTICMYSICAQTRCTTCAFPGILQEKNTFLFIFTSIPQHRTVPHAELLVYENSVIMRSGAQSLTAREKSIPRTLWGRKQGTDKARNLILGKETFQYSDGIFKRNSIKFSVVL